MLSVGALSVSPALSPVPLPVAPVALPVALEVARDTAVYAGDALLGSCQRIADVASSNPFAFSMVVGSIVASSVAYDVLLKQKVHALLAGKEANDLQEASESENIPDWKFDMSRSGNARYAAEEMLHPGKALMKLSVAHALVEMAEAVVTHSGNMLTVAPDTAFQHPFGDFLFASGMIALVRTVENTSSSMESSPMFQAVGRAAVYGAFLLCALDDVALPLALLARMNPF